MKTMTGVDIKHMIHAEGLKCWQVAEFLRISDSSFSRRLRKPFNAAEVEKIKDIIERIKYQQIGTTL